ncbi:NAD(P)-dependent oxidoreductase [Acidithiobacillus sp.]|uniref:NAD(P)-dependent oxidoreductase n=1 Tax=Acidithiobacillus sp. TaxID=1872118 RepID=UPI0025BA09E4|nr:NAD(P)-dependent oxidoreductase [Acidithiobacillus sp.]
MKLGFLGLGRMGSGMAARLLTVAPDLKVYNRSATATRPLADRGATVVQSIADFGDCDLVFTMVADDSAERDLSLGSGGLAQTLPAGAIHVACSTISVDCARALDAAHREHGQSYLSMPVFGRPDAAAAGKLFLVAAGPAEIFAAIAPYRERLGQRSFHLGERPEQANLVKLSGNYLIATVIESLGEAMALVEKGGIDRHAYLELLTGTLFDAPVYRNYGKLIADRQQRPAGFALPLAQKDLRLVMAAAEDLAVPLPFSGPLRDRFLQLAAQGHGDLDWSALGVGAAQAAGLPVVLGGDEREP